MTLKRGKGKPRAEVPRRMLAVRLTEDQYEALTARAREDGVYLGRWIREIALGSSPKTRHLIGDIAAYERKV